MTTLEIWFRESPIDSDLAIMVRTTKWTYKNSPAFAVYEFGEVHFEGWEGFAPHCDIEDKRAEEIANDLLASGFEKVSEDIINP